MLERDGRIDVNEVFWCVGGWLWGMSQVLIQRKKKKTKYEKR